MTIPESNHTSPWNQSAVVVTGASSGIGQQVAVSLAQAGTAHVMIHYRGNRDGAEKTAALARQSGAKTTLIRGDLSVFSDVERIASEAFAASPTIHAWIHNAGADVLTGDAAQLDFGHKLQRLWQVDVEGTICLARSVAIKMAAQPSSDRPPSMVFLGWDQAPHGMEGDAGQMFGPIKAAVMAFAASLAQTLAPSIRVNTVAPGWIKTDWGQNHASDQWTRRAQAQSLMGRWGTPEDVAAAVLYAANPAHTFLTGQTLEVNGGWNRNG